MIIGRRQFINGPKLSMNVLQNVNRLEVLGYVDSQKGASSDRLMMGKTIHRVGYVCVVWKSCKTKMKKDHIGLRILVPFWSK